MAQLSSPGVSVSITDESAYTSAPAGTIPLIFVASLPPTVLQILFYQTIFDFV